MNSMNDIIKKIKAALNPLQIDEPAGMQIACVVKSDEIHAGLSYLKNLGFRQLCILTCIDWIDDSELELVYVLFSWDHGIHIQLRARIDRNKPSFITITDIYPGARYYEREVHEFFGVEFEGNEDYAKPLFLELWDDLPPLRKDFDPQVYSDSKFPLRDRENVFAPKTGGPENERS